MNKKYCKSQKYKSDYSIFSHAVTSIIEKEKPIVIKPLEVMPLEKCKLEAVIERSINDTYVKD